MTLTCHNCTLWTDHDLRDPCPTDHELETWATDLVLQVTSLETCTDQWHCTDHELENLARDLGPTDHELEILARGLGPTDYELETCTTG